MYVHPVADFNEATPRSRHLKKCRMGTRFERLERQPLPIVAWKPRSDSLWIFGLYAFKYVLSRGWKKLS